MHGMQLETTDRDNPGSGSTAANGRRERLARWLQLSGMLPVAGALRNLVRSDFRILGYHRILESADPHGFHFDVELISATAEAFRRQMAWLRRHYQPIRFDQFLEYAESGRQLPPRAVLVTFDDGYDDNYRIAYPILRELDMSAMFFVSTGHIESGLPYTYDWLVHMLSCTPRNRVELPRIGETWELPASRQQRRQLASRLLDRMKSLDALDQEQLVAELERTLDMPRHPHVDCQPMSWTQLREMQQGGMEIGSHGIHHRMLGKLPDDEMRNEVSGSKLQLERELQVGIDAISYPVGSADAFSDEVELEARKAGYRVGCSYTTGMAQAAPGMRFRMPRLPVEVMREGWFEGMMALPEAFTYPTRKRIG